MLPSAPDLAAIAALPERELRREGLVVAEGRLVAERLLAAGRFEPLVVACVPALAERMELLAAGRCPVLALSEPELARLAGFPFHRGALVAARRPPERRLSALGPELGSATRLLLLPETRDPANLGALIRSAAALGFSAALLGPGCADALSRRALRASMGAVLGIPLAGIGGPEELRPLRHSGFRLAASVLDAAAVELGRWKPPERLILAVGEEYGGLGPEWVGAADELVTIAMAPGPDSLNAAAAGAILMHAARGSEGDGRSGAARHPGSAE